jgi:hypothetical protein
VVVEVGLTVAIHAVGKADDSRPLCRLFDVSTKATITDDETTRLEVAQGSQDRGAVRPHHGTIVATERQQN